MKANPNTPKQKQTFSTIFQLNFLMLTEDFKLLYFKCEKYTKYFFTKNINTEQSN